METQPPDTAQDTHDTAGQTPPQPQVPAQPQPPARFVSDEICVVVATKPNVNTVDTYHAVRAHLNTLLRPPASSGVETAGTASTSTGAGAVRYDLRRTAPRTHTLVPVGNEVRGFARDFTLSAAALQSLTTAAGILRPLDAPEHAALTLHATHEQPGLSTTAIYRYKVGAELDTIAARQARVGSVRELVQLVNHRVGDRPVGKDPTGGNWQITATTPNWLAAIAQGPETGPCPGTPPEPIEEDEGTPPTAPRNWTFGAGGTGDTGGAGSGGATAGETRKVVVAVLDSSPDAAQVQAAAARFRSPDAAPPNLWNRIIAPANPLHIEGTLGTTATDLDHLHEIIPDHRGAAAAWLNTSGDDALKELARTHYALPDHGLFVGGIIKDLAPGAEVHLVRVLSDTGVGDLFTLNRALLAVAQRYAHGGARLIINLSLTIAVPPNDDAVREWHPHASQSLDEVCHHVTDLTAALNRTHHSLRVMIDWLAQQDILVIAAAGNDSYPDAPGEQRHEPALPARYRAVLSVAAMAGTRAPATYSNQGAEVIFTNGVATWGGNAEMRDGTLRIAGSSGTRDGVAGIFSADALPAISDETGTHAPPNTMGWVYWAGTSFATPIITGIAANIWAQDPTLPIAAVRDAVIARASTDEHEAGELDCDGIVMAQTRAFYPA